MEEGDDDDTSQREYAIAFIAEVMLWCCVLFPLGCLIYAFGWLVSP